ncbi:MAG TPA: type II toxin-antitoxin system Phd/YefM family antitoxin [Candidatus Limnocylindrales bacterium]
MRTMRALEVRAKFGEVLDEAAAGERIVVERAGHPVAAIVPLSDLEAVDPDRIRQRQDEAWERLLKLAKRNARQGVPVDWAAWIRQDRDSGHSV